jgi:hypothetical protein
MVISVRIEVACLGSADAERGHGDRANTATVETLNSLFIEVLLFSFKF